jgi:diguanylate cyclase (GGDEF)-like protein
MISLKRYLDAVDDESPEPMERGANTLPNGAAKRLEALIAPNARELLTVAVAAYRSALLETGKYSLEACPALGDGLKRGLQKLHERLAFNVTREAIESAERGVKEQLEDWGERTAKHYLAKTGEVKELLLVLARTAESVGERDQRCALQLNEVTARLNQIAGLDDLTLIRASIVKSASELKSSIDRMAAEGKTAIDRLRAEVSNYQSKLDEAEEIASSDSLTGLRSRLCVEHQIERRMDAGGKFCLAIADIDGFKQVNDKYGHLTGDELLKQFATELRSASRSTDVIGRLGGDEFILLLDCALAEAHAQVDRLQAWVCGSYTVAGNGEPIKLRVDASFGLAEHLPEETMKELMDRADAEMYQQKAVFRAQGAGSRR